VGGGGKRFSKFWFCFIGDISRTLQGAGPTI